MYNPTPTNRELREKFGVKSNHNRKGIANAVLRKDIAGGAELLDLKEWAGGIANHAKVPGSKKLGAEMLARITEIQRTILVSLEAEHDLPPGTFSDSI